MPQIALAAGIDSWVLWLIAIAGVVAGILWAATWISGKDRH